MGFLTPWFLVGGLAVGLPVWLHLLRKHKTTPLPFSSLMFFEKRTQSSIKHRRLRYLLLFAARTALLLLLALAFAHPFVRQRILPVAGGSGDVGVAVIDNSLSMRSGNRLETAKQQAKSYINSLRAGQKGQILAFGQRVQVMSELTDDRGALNAGIDAIQPGDTRTSYAELSRSLRSIATSLKRPLDVHLFSDMQQTGMPPNFSDLKLNAALKLEPHSVMSGDNPNFTVENVVVPQRVYAAKSARVLVTVAGFNNKKATRSVTLSLNGRTVESKQVEVPEHGRATVEFLNMDVPYGRNKGEVRIDSADALPADDVFYFSTERDDSRKALFVHDADSSRDVLYFKEALEASGQSAFDIEPVTTEQTANLNPSKYAFVVLSDAGIISPTFENALRNYVSGGGSLLIALGHHTVANGKVPVSGEKIESTSYAGREGPRFQAVGTMDSAHPTMLKDDRWDDVKFYQAIRVTPGNARVVARLTDQTPLLLDQQIGAGRELVFASTFDNVANDFPIHPSFVPFVERTARYLGHLESGPSSLLVGSFAELRDPKEKGSAVDVVDPKGNRVFTLEEASKAQNVQFTMAGFYDIRRPSGRNELVAVNADRHESDLSPIPQETIKLWQNTANGTSDASGGAGGDAEQKPLSLWWYVMLLVLTIAAVESFLGNQHLSVDKEAA